MRKGVCRLSSKFSRLLTFSLLTICVALIGVTVVVSRGELRQMLWMMGNNAGLNLLVLGCSLFLVFWGCWGLLRRPASPTEERRWPWIRALAGLAFASLSLWGFVTNPGQLENLVGWLFEKDITNTERVATLQDTDLTTLTTDASKDWPQWLGPNRDGRSTETGLNVDWQAKEPAELWRKPLGGGYSSVLQVGGMLYTMDRQGSEERVVCLEAATGNEVWSYRSAADYGTLRMGYAEGPRATPAVQNGRIYTVGATGQFLCLALPEKGQQPRLLWKHDLVPEFEAYIPSWGVSCSPLLEGDMVIVQPGGKAGSVVAFDKVSGEVKWKALADKPGYSSPIAATLGGVRQIICFTGENLVGLQASDGKPLWTQKWKTQFECNAATPVLVGKCVFISSGYNKGCALYEIQGEGAEKLTAVPLQVRLRKLMRNHHSNCVLHDNHLYGFDEDELRCFQVRTFESVWSSDQPGKGCLIYADGHLIILTQQGMLTLVEANPKKYVVKGQKQVFQAKQTWAFPTLSDGRLYLRSNEAIVCLDMRK